MDVVNGAKFPTSYGLNKLYTLTIRLCSAVDSSLGFYTQLNPKLQQFLLRYRERRIRDPLSCRITK